MIMNRSVTKYGLKTVQLRHNMLTKFEALVDDA